jgi:hypothetical protein
MIRSFLAIAFEKQATPESLIELTFGNQNSYIAYSTTSGIMIKLS